MTKNEDVKKSKNNKLGTVLIIILLAIGLFFLAREIGWIGSDEMVTCDGEQIDTYPDGEPLYPPAGHRVLNFVCGDDGLWDYDPQPEAIATQISTDAPVVVKIPTMVVETQVPTDAPVIQDPSDEPVCLEEAEAITPAGDVQPDLSYIAHDLGEVGRWLAWDGELWVQGESKNDGVHDYILFEGGYLDLRVWQGTLYQYCDLLDYDDVFSIVVDRMSPDKFLTEPGVTMIRIWKVVGDEIELVQTLYP